MRIALVNTNRIKPPVAPIGLEYVAEILISEGHDVHLLDLCWEDDYQTAIGRFFNNDEYGLVGMTLRNTDDCAYSSRQSFLKSFAEMVMTVRSVSGAFVVLGGVGFSVMPEDVLSMTGADAGVWGEGEFTMASLASRLSMRQHWQDLPNLVWQEGGKRHRSRISFGHLGRLPAMKRRFVDNKRYFREGGQAGFETKRGCPRSCIYCADPVAKGSRLRLRPPFAVAGELQALLSQGIDHLHTCDAEFNLSGEHAMAVCDALIQHGISEKIRWYAYCTPVPFSRDLAKRMRSAGCAGINFGVDHGDENMLKRLKRDFKPDDVRNAVQWSREAGMNVMLDLLIGSPGESRKSVTQAIRLMQQTDAQCIGIALGLRVYPGTELARKLLSGKTTYQLPANDDPAEPMFFLEPSIASDVTGWLNRLIGNDSRFFFFNPEDGHQNYNYNANEVLADAIRSGHRGAYWDILRRIRAG